MKFLILTLFPEMFESPFSTSIIKRAQEQKLISIQTKNIRDFAEGKRKNIDDVPFGGGAGMLMKIKPVHKAINWAKKEFENKPKVIYLTPQGKTFSQKKAIQLVNQKKPLILLCGHYEGIDERIRQNYIDEEISIGNYVLTGGELPAMVLIDSIARLVPKVLAKEESTKIESFSEDIFYQKEYPQYTRPAEFQDHKVPQVLLSGHHAKIQKWQMENLRGLSELEKKILKIRLQEFPKKTRNLIFRLHKKEDIFYWLKWLNNKEVTKMMSRINPPITQETEEEFFENSKKNLKTLRLTVLDKKTKKPIATVGLDIDLDNEKKANFGFIIGDKSYWNKGLGTEILQTMIKIGFEKIGLIKICSKIFIENKASQRVHEKCGFQLIGITKKEALKKDGWHDCCLMEIIYKKNR